jgi:hypothetical protein
MEMGDVTNGMITKRDGVLLTIQEVRAKDKKLRANHALPEVPWAAHLREHLRELNHC